MNGDLFRYCGKDIRKVGFLGFGRSNRGVYEYLCRHYPTLEYTVRARYATDDIPKEVRRRCFEKKMLSGIDEDVLFLSPSARRDEGAIAAASERGVILSSDAELFFARKKSDIYAVTGSDGKSTTTYLTAALLRQGYDSAIPCGNFGEALSPHIDDCGNFAYVTELSSFQLMYCAPRSKRCVITNITENHLDWHRSFDEYINAKKSILDGAEERIFNLDSEISRNIAREYGAYAVYSCKMGESELRRLVSARLYMTLDGEWITLSGKRILRIQDIKASGKYNIYNYMAAMLMSYGVWSPDDLRTLAKSFHGLAHRLETVGIYDGVRYINSSIDSTPLRTAATLSSLDGEIILILGGRSKGLDYKTLFSLLQGKVKLIIAVGESGTEIFEQFTESTEFLNLHIPIRRFEGLLCGVEYAMSVARPKDTVLLSPASTSYDEFKNFEERGAAFVNFIKERQNKNGV